METNIEKEAEKFVDEVLSGIDIDEFEKNLYASSKAYRELIEVCNSESELTMKRAIGMTIGIMKMLGLIIDKK